MERDARDLDLVKIIRACKDAGVLRFAAGDVEILFAPHEQILQARVQAGGSYDNMDKTAGGNNKREVDGDDEADLRQRQIEELLITDPVAYEELHGDDNIDRTILDREGDDGWRE